jgi:hypothetical protein
MEMDDNLRAILEKSVDESIAEISGFAESYARPYLDQIINKVIYDLENAGYEIVKKK